MDPTAVGPCPGPLLLKPGWAINTCSESHCYYAEAFRLFFLGVTYESDGEDQRVCCFK